MALDDGLAEAHATLALILVSDWETRGGGVRGAARRGAGADQLAPLLPARARLVGRRAPSRGSDDARPSTRTSRSRTSRWRWCTWRADTSTAPRRFSAKAPSSRIGRSAARERYPALGLHWLLGADPSGRRRRRRRARAVRRRAGAGRRRIGSTAASTRCSRVTDAGMALIRAGRLDEAAHELRARAGALSGPRAEPPRDGVAASAPIGAGRLPRRPWLTPTRCRRFWIARAPSKRQSSARRVTWSRAGCPRPAQTLAAMLKGAPPGFAGWAIPVEPLFRDLVQDQSFTAVSELLAARATLRGSQLLSLSHASNRTPASAGSYRVNRSHGGAGQCRRIRYRETLKHRGLQPFLWTQFLGAFNDNFFKFVVSMVAVHTAVDEAASGRNALAGRRRLRRAVPAVFGLRRPACRRLQQAHGARRHEVARDRRRPASACSPSRRDGWSSPTPCCS